MKVIAAIFIIICTKNYAYSQKIVNNIIPCDSIILGREKDIHRPEKNTYFLAAADLIYPYNWKNEDTILLSAFTINSLYNNMPIVVFVPTDSNNLNTGEIHFSSLIYFEHGEYGYNHDSSYYVSFQIKNNIIVLQEKYWFTPGKGKGRKYKYMIIWEGINCCKLIRLNPTKRKLFPKAIKMRDKKKITRVGSFE